jgi:hypothetical protein
MAFSLVKDRVKWVIKAGAQTVGKDGIKALKKRALMDFCYMGRVN